ncbi:DUF1496 domain-containing protein [Pseudoalteromonas phenolica]|uniref:DUF1496 domain-containing protein n=1 Tax=Pseudoalteromonas phenolica TaxID=161398 RepID=A0A0S2K745_9GAMM|nr:DUF1496 domain-containing protein [Pseudoalteromonas phenolica]ALO43859.1 hypothetical protein PP2015_3384 [Pseudoalteromonas phenolica]MBE0354964.1 hypothetical protein [Pseudoalteromonas phenolica O-BC30]RXF04784.1 DUF1496 domain-containing protein [Pseudoalteromonas phenolica O-BC30]
MNKCVFAMVFLIPVMSFASDQDISESSSDKAQKVYDSTQFCYYADKEFSEGARHYIGDVVQLCTKREDNTLYWKTL